MKKLIGFILALLSFIFICGSSYAQENTAQIQDSLQNPEIKKIKTFIDNYNNFSNKRQMEKIRKFYADSYISGDGFKLNEILSLAKESWQAYPDIFYSSEIRNIRITDSFASVETLDRAVSEKARKSEITNDLGKLESNSGNIIYLQKFGDNWKIISDRVNFEKTSIKYGIAKNLDVKFEAPEQVNSGEKYTASLYTDMPDNTFSVASITKEPIISPRQTPDEVFRQVPKYLGILERLLEANASNYNEIACASVEYAEFNLDATANSNIKPTGIALILQRVNVIPAKTPLKPVISVDNSNDTEPFEDVNN